MYNPFLAGGFVGTIVILLAIWTVVCKIYGVWLAVKNDHKKWFVAILLLNTAGILEIFYIFRIAKKNWAEVKDDFKYAWISFFSKEKKEDITN